MSSRRMAGPVPGPVAGLLTLTALATLAAGGCSSSDYDADVSAAELRAALDRTGLDVCDATDLDWDIAGFDGGESFHIGSDCDAPEDEHRRFKVVVARFDNEAARDVAYAAASTNVRIHHRNASVWTYGPYVIVPEGEKDRDDYDKLVDALDDIGAK